MIKLSRKSKMRKFNIFLFIVIVFNVTVFALPTEVTVQKTSSWVQPQKVNYDSITESYGKGSIRNYLIDRQFNTRASEAYYSYSFQALSLDGVSEISDIDISFDPTYQKLVFHEVSIVRNGKRIQQLEKNEFRIIQRETDMERKIYNGRVSAILNLKDIRINDVVEYSFTIKGQHPSFKGEFFKTMYLQYSEPTDKIAVRVLTDRNLHFNYFNEGSEPTITNLGNGLSEYKWLERNVEGVIYDDNTPSGHNSYDVVQVSTLENWEEVAKLLQPMYLLPKKPLSIVDELLANSGQDKELEITKLIRFVQDEIRYLGLEGGIESYKPSEPNLVVERRFGDCKDKSFLLATMLQQIGVEAYPMLVNTAGGEDLMLKYHSPYAFDHCVLYLNYNNTDYFVDPTIGSQGGKLEDISFPNYEYGLLMKNGEKELVNLPDADDNLIETVETFYITSMDSSVKLEVVSNYYGSTADMSRRKFQKTSLNKIEKSYLDYYAVLYPDIRLNGNIVIEDDRGDENVFIVKEYYVIDNFWMDEEVDSNLKYCDIYPLMLEDWIYVPESSKRSMPYYLGGPVRRVNTTIIDLFEPWDVEPEQLSIEGPGFKYINEVEYSKLKNKITITHDYELLERDITAQESDMFLEKHEDIKNHLHFYLNYDYNIVNPKPVNNDSTVLITVFLTVLGGIGAIFFFLYKNWSNQKMI